MSALQRECLECGGSVERVGWDDLCFRCQESEKAEIVGDDEWDDEDWIAEENRRLYTLPWGEEAR